MTTPGRPDRRIWRDTGADADDEIAFHLDMRQRDLVARGLSEADARREARRRFGSVEHIAREVRTIDDAAARQQRRTGMWTDFRQDVVYALRGLRRAPGFTLVAVLTLALGIGANTAIFSVLNVALLRPLPYADGDRLVFVWNDHQGSTENLGPGRMLDLRRQATSFSGVAGIAHLAYTLTGSGDPERIAAASVSSGFFDLLGARPQLGEPFHADAADPSAVVLSHALWTRRFGADPAIVGRTIVLDNTPRLVVAVMRRDFFWPSITTRAGAAPGPELWVPPGAGDIPRNAVDEHRDMTASRNAGYLRAVARLKPGVTVARANAELAAVGARISAEHPDDGGRTAKVRTIREQFFGPVERPLFVLAGVVTLVLATACANVAGLLLGRGSARRRDLALRRALGATRSRLVRQLLTEATVLSIAGAIAGLVLAWWAAAALAATAPADFIGAQPLPLDIRVLGFALAVSILCGLAFGAVPAMQLSRGLSGALSEGSTRSTSGRRAGRTRDVLVAAEIAVAVVLLVGSALFVRSFLHLTRVDVGLDTRHLLTFDVSLTGERAAVQARQVQFYEALQERLSRVPGVRAVGAAVTLPIGGDDFGTWYLPEGVAPPPQGGEPRAGYQVVAPGYFAAMGIPLKAGRDVRATDTRQSEPVVLINEQLARDAWPGQDPVGRRIRFGSGGDGWSRVVGVVGDIRHLGPSTQPRPEVYQPHSQRSFPFMVFVVRTDTDPMAIAPAIRRAAAELDPTLPLGGLRTMEQHLQRSLSKPRFLSTLVTAFGALAVTLALIGIYAMMAWSVSERRQEFAIRIALGARGSAVIGMVLRQALILAGAGVAAGLGAAWAATGIVAGMLHGIRPTDPSAFALAAAGVTVVAVVACYVPARRALGVDPVTLLR